MNLLVCFIGLILFAAPAAAADNLSPRVFTETAAAAAKAAMPSAIVTVTGDLQLQTRSPGGETTSTDLRNAYEVYLRDPKNLENVIRRYIGVLVETIRLGDTKATVDRSRIVPVLKAKRWVDGVGRAPNGAGKIPELLTEPFNSELTIVYAEDRPQSIRFLTTRDDVGDRAKLHDTSLANLSRFLPQIEMETGGSGSYLIHAGGSYEASLLLVDALWSSGQIKVDGDIVVAVPARDVLMVTGSQNEASVTRIRALATKLATGPYALTSALFVYRGGKFLTFESR
jgi:uncharacterized protein YtpQ (UPF0354 family)